MRVVDGSLRGTLRDARRAGWLNSKRPSGRGSAGAGSRASLARVAAAPVRGARALRRGWWPFALIDVFICLSTFCVDVNLLTIFDRLRPGCALRVRPWRPLWPMVVARERAARRLLSLGELRQLVG